MEESSEQARCVNAAVMFMRLALGRLVAQIPLPSRLPHNIEQSFLCCTVGPS